MTDSVPVVPQRTAKELQIERMAAQPPIYTAAHERLAYELALSQQLNEDPVSIFANHGYNQDSALQLLSTEHFALLLNKAKVDVQQNGLAFRAKAKIQAEALLAHSFDMATDPLQPPAVRADLIKWTGKMADLEPRPKDDGKQATGGFSMTITFSGAAPQQVINEAPVTIEHEAGE